MPCASLESFRTKRKKTRLKDRFCSLTPCGPSHCSDGALGLPVRFDSEAAAMNFYCVLALIHRTALNHEDALLVRFGGSLTGAARHCVCARARAGLRV